ncbi:MAG: cobalamin-dependent protein, partial [Candidatus Methanomethyliaceae archaeon]|nr:cobalamin-dependent protein [Candidatus Methanomethyliaceae archaeon]MDW7971042.1 cobalamin-dependent protein [Nitrososphaerota archaeon]
MVNEFDEILKAVMNGDTFTIINLINDGLKKGENPKKIFEALATGMIRLGEKLSKKEIFLPELVIAFEAFKRGMEILEPILKSEGERTKKLKVVLGTVQGDIHNIGKEIVKVMLEAANCEVYDLGVDVPPEKFVEKVIETNADILGCSCLISIGIPYLKKTVEKVKSIRGGKTKILIGGFVTSPELANELG